MVARLTHKQPNEPECKSVCCYCCCFHIFHRINIWRVLILTRSIDVVPSINWLRFSDYIFELARLPFSWHWLLRECISSVVVVLLLFVFFSSISFIFLLLLLLSPVGRLGWSAERLPTQRTFPHEEPRSQNDDQHRNDQRSPLRRWRLSVLHRCWMFSCCK